MTTGGRTALILLAVLVTAAVATAAVLGWFLTRLSFSYDRVDRIENAFPQSRPVERTDKARTYLLLGIDSRGTIDGEALDGPQDGRSDSMMIVHLPADREDVYFVSVMRDSWVDIPGVGEGKINAAMAHGGVPLAIEVVEDLIGTRIDQAAVIDFTGFKDLTNALGGVTVTNTEAFEAGGYNFPLGDITLDGDEALVYVRARKPFEDGDYQRVRNQQSFMKGVAKTMISTDTLKNPQRLVSVVDAIGPFMAVTDGLTTDYIVRTATSLRDVRMGNLFFMTVPTTGPGSVGDQSVVFLDEEGVKALREAFETDTLGEFYDSQE